MFQWDGKDGIPFVGKEHGKIRGRGTETGNGHGEVGRVITKKKMTAALKGDG